LAGGFHDARSGGGGGGDASAGGGAGAGVNVGRESWSGVDLSGGAGGWSSLPKPIRIRSPSKNVPSSARRALTAPAVLSALTKAYLSGLLPFVHFMATPLTLQYGPNARARSCLPVETPIPATWSVGFGSEYRPAGAWWRLTTAPVVPKPGIFDAAATAAANFASFLLATGGPDTNSWPSTRTRALTLPFGCVLKMYSTALPRFS